MKRYIVLCGVTRPPSVWKETDDLNEAINKAAELANHYDQFHCVAVVKDRFDGPSEFVTAYVSEVTMELAEKCRKEVAL